MGARLWDYSAAVLGYWQFWVAVALMIERATERLSPSWWKKVDKRFSAEWRRRLLVGIAIIAFLYANFRAFNDERDKAIAATNEKNAVIGERDAVRTQAEDRQREIDRLNARIAALEAQIPKAIPTRDPDGLYQLGQLVGSVGPARIDQGNGTVEFDGVRSAGNLNPNAEVEYRDFVLQCVGLPMAPSIGFSGTVSSVSTGARCKILRQR